MAASLQWQPEIGVLGTGRMGSRLAAMFARAGRRVILGSRDRDRAQEVVDSLRLPNIIAGTNCEAVRAPAILPAIFIRDGLFDVLVTGDDSAAKARFFELAAGTPFRYLDAGPLLNSRTVERLTLITSRVGRSLNAYPQMNWRLLTQEQIAAVA